LLIFKELLFFIQMFFELFRNFLQILYKLLYYIVHFKNLFLLTANLKIAELTVGKTTLKSFNISLNKDI